VQGTLEKNKTRSGYS